VEQSVKQNGKLALKTSTVIVHFDYGAKKPEPLTENIKLQLLAL